MTSAILSLVLALCLASVSTAEAACNCVCADGNVVAACSGSLDIPPICPMRTCAQPTIRRPPPIKSGGGCSEVKSCDRYGNCRWATNCR